MTLITDFFRRLAVLGVTLFFAGLIVYLVAVLIQNPQVLNSVFAAIGDMIGQIFSLANGG